MKWIRERLPAWPGIFPVYSALVFWAYGWYMLMFMFKLPSWMLEVTFGEIVAYFSYGLILVFWDTVQMLAILVGLSFVLPRSWLNDDFSVSGTALAGLLFFWIMFAQFAFVGLVNLPPSQQIAVLVVALLGFILAVLLVRRFPAFRKLAVWFGSSAGIFAYLYGFLTALGVVVVLIRNLS
ncbi:MAG: hypothetical protein C4583_02350 [Anaerolineaceae bacterium]|nr:MAG: hypothetical protein C4583_02350 [Anaerolineaceae bacterium]